jgi:very-short-patch-repair endonuclease
MFTPRQTLNKAYLKVKPSRHQIEGFKTHLKALLDGIDDAKREEYHKTLLTDFLKKAHYDGQYFVNVKDDVDLAIHNGQKPDSAVAVLLEVKKPSNAAEMPKVGKLNSKALQELVLYYLRERITHNNLEVKHLIITNIREWFVFDAQSFDRLFAQNKGLVKQFTDFEAGRLSESKTDFFYKQIAEPFIANLQNELPYTWFELAAYEKALRNADKTDDNKLIALYKLLSPEHLLKLPFANDSNSLDKRFYSELLHIIGLTEVKDGGKKLIQRNKAGERHSGSLLEDAIIQLDSLDKLSRLDRNGQAYGANTQDRLFNVALELVITWVNRILFLKLLEAQLLSYQKGDKSYAFLNSDKIKSYDDLNSLFFQVLARSYEERNDDVAKLFDKVPYLNSSLFEPTELEQLTLFISNLRDDKQMPVHSQTVLKDEQGRKRSGSMGALAYLFAFLDAYDFGAEGSEDIQEDNKTLINASVLGLIFEKINGYKDGSFFTPGFITMYMCRETIRKAVLQKFNEAAATMSYVPPQGGAEAPLLRGFGGTSRKAGQGSAEPFRTSEVPPQGGAETPHLRVAGQMSAEPVRMSEVPPQGGAETPHLRVAGQMSAEPVRMSEVPPQGGAETPLLRGVGGVSSGAGPNPAPRKTPSAPPRTIIPYNPRLKLLARELRNNSTKTEIMLWKELKGKFAGKYDFHRQKPLDNYIADFFCYELKLVIELDGITHEWEETQKKDFIKECRLNELGLNVLRFDDDEVYDRFEQVLQTIHEYVAGFEKGDLSSFKREDTPLNPLSRGDFHVRDDLGESVTLAASDAGTEEHFAPSKGGQPFQTLDDVYEHIGDGRMFSRQQANDIVNSIKICDPAVGSGHFLVSALNEMIAIKSDLQILQDREGRRLKNYTVEVINDELIVTDEEGALFEYRPAIRSEVPPQGGAETPLLRVAGQMSAEPLRMSDVPPQGGAETPLLRGAGQMSAEPLRMSDVPPQGGAETPLLRGAGGVSRAAGVVSESQRIQETLFHEKQTIIENCLFGVDINPNSVKICRLRLWIELLKNAYYKTDTSAPLLRGAGGVSRGAGGVLETLPNIDINIKTGNSLVSRFALDADLKQALRKSKFGIDAYRVAVATYRNAESKEQKREMERLIAHIKSDFRSEIAANDPKIKRLQKLEYDYGLLVAPNMFREDAAAYGTKANQKKAKERESKMLADINKLKAEIEEIKANKIYENAFEWRFEFPEVLNDEGDFVGFDVVIGNPPYGVKHTAMDKTYYSGAFTSIDDIYTIFIELALRTVKATGIINYIIPITWLTGPKYINTRKLFVSRNGLIKAVNLPYDVFSDAYVDTGMYFFSPKHVASAEVYEFSPKARIQISDLLSIPFNILPHSNWSSKADLKININEPSNPIFQKIDSIESKLADFTETARGILADKSEYQNHHFAESKPVFIGNLNRYTLDYEMKFIRYGDNLKEKPKSYEFFIGERILVRRIVNRQFRLMAAHTSKEFVCKKDIYVLKIIDEKISYKCLLAILNSKLISYYKTNNTGAAKKDDFTQITLRDIRELPVPSVNPELQIDFIKLVTEVESSILQNIDTTALEAEIDQLVYTLYGLTEEEIKIVEGV